ncbi:hypothetical protein BYT27DRAFT_6531531 [Phlegmacium glaucopus]|nr:hypothetical protein BYT27DRAFT_6531531 [Phlegmacium glaucopus]
MKRVASTTAQAAEPIPKVAPSPARPRVAKVGVAASPAGRKKSSTKEASTPSSTLKRAAATLNIETKKTKISPVRDPHGNSGSIGDISVQLDDLADLRRGKANTTPVKKTSADHGRTRPSPSPRNAAPTNNTGRVCSAKNTEVENPRRARTLPTKTSTNTESASGREGLVVAQTHLNPPIRPRAGSSALRTDSDAIFALSSAANKFIRPVPVPLLLLANLHLHPVQDPPFHAPVEWF